VKKFVLTRNGEKHGKSAEVTAKIWINTENI
jgi:hypothetical protein